MRHTPIWQRPKTSRIYLHPIYSGRLVSMYPDMKVTDLELSDRAQHFDQSGFGVHLLSGQTDETSRIGMAKALREMDMELTEWQKPSPGAPIYTLINEENGLCVEMTALCDPKMEEEGPAGWQPATYVKVRVRNLTARRMNALVGLLPRYNDKDHYLTGLHDTGYEPYDPKVDQWYLSWKAPFTLEKESAEAFCLRKYGWMKVLGRSGKLEWVSRDEQKHRFLPHDVFVMHQELEPGETGELIFVMRKTPMAAEAIPTWDEVFDRTKRTWQEIQDQVKVVPASSLQYDLEGLFRQNIVTALQMLQHYEESSQYIFARQGDVGRYLWVWEAVQYLTMFDRIGLGRYAEAPYRMWLDRWQIKEGPEKGKVDNPYVDWANTNGSLLAGLSFHLLVTDDEKAFASFKDQMDLALNYIQYRRDPAEAGEGEVKGLFTSGKASDWNEVGQHWTYTDAVNVKGLEWMTRCYEHFEAENAHHVRSVYEEYLSAVKGVLYDLAAGHEGEEAFVMPHILGVPFEDSYNHCFYTDGEPYLLKLGILDPSAGGAERTVFDQMENFFREAGFLDDEHGLAGRMTNDDCGSPGLYGNVYYTGVPEVCWIKAWDRLGEKEKADRYTRGILEYNVTPEGIPSERYCSADPWFTPWQPNGSGAGRLCHFLLDHFGEKHI